MINKNILHHVINWTLHRTELALTWELLHPVPGGDLLQPWPKLSPQGLTEDHQTPQEIQSWGADLPHVHPLAAQTTMSLLHQWRLWTAGMENWRKLSYPNILWQTIITVMQNPLYLFYNKFHLIFMFNLMNGNWLSSFSNYSSFMILHSAYLTNLCPKYYITCRNSVSCALDIMFETGQSHYWLFACLFLHPFVKEVKIWDYE